MRRVDLCEEREHVGGDGEVGPLRRDPSHVGSLEIAGWIGESCA
jgi:hypothetical protein